MHLVIGDEAPGGGRIGFSQAFIALLTGMDGVRYEGIPGYQSLQASCNRYYEVERARQAEKGRAAALLGAGLSMER